MICLLFALARCAGDDLPSGGFHKRLVYAQGRALPAGEDDPRQSAVLSILSVMVASAEV
jgi:hypothetical protein